MFKSIFNCFNGGYSKDILNCDWNSWYNEMTYDERKQAWRDLDDSDKFILREKGIKGYEYDF